MSVNSIVVDAAPEAVFNVLATAERYADWVVGAHQSAPVDPRWPQPGACFRHTSGLPPLVVRDTTTVLASEPPRHLQLNVHARPLLEAIVDITIEPHTWGSRVTMREDVVGGVGRFLPRRLNEALLRRRNQLALRRLRELADTGAGEPARTGA